MFDIPPLVLVEILSRLPVKSLLRFRSVSKHWCDLIDSPYFVRFHSNQSKEKYKVLTFFRPSYSKISSYPIISSYALSLNSHPTIVNVEPPFDLIDFYPRDLSSCNGLICLSWGNSNQELSLWNPSTRKHRLIPTMPIHYPLDTENHFIIDTLGYDHISDDFKVVRVLQFIASDQNSFQYKVLVYSLKLNVWQYVEQDFPYQFFCVACTAPVSHSVCVGGAVHWSVIKSLDPDKNYLIVAYDLASQSFRLVPQPEYSEKYISLDVGILGGCLCVVGIQEMNYVDISVMEKYGVKESWRKLVTMENVAIYPCIRPLVYMKNCKEVILEVNHEQFLRYDLEKKTYKMIIRDPSMICKFRLSNLSTCLYEETLV